MELVGFRGVIIRQGGISGALHTSPSRLKNRPFLERHSQQMSVTTYSVGLETAAGPED